MAVHQKLSGAHPTSHFELVACDRDGRPERALGRLPDQLLENCKGTAKLYRTIGFNPPWIGYVAVCGGGPVGGGAFVGAPRHAEVEIAYFTLAGLEGLGHGSRTVLGLVNIARQADPGVTMVANTLPETGASTHILRKLGFSLSGTTIDDEVGEAWHWRLPPAGVRRP